MIWSLAAIKPGTLRLYRTHIKLSAVRHLGERLDKSIFVLTNEKSTK